MAEDPGYVPSPRDPLETSTDCGNSDDSVEGWETIDTEEKDGNGNYDGNNNKGNGNNDDANKEENKPEKHQRKLSLQLPKTATIRKKDKKKKRKQITAPLKIQRVRVSSALTLSSRAETPNYVRFPDGRIRRGVDWVRTTCFEDRIVNSYDLADMTELTIEEQDAWVSESLTNGEGLTLEQQEKQAFLYLQTHPVVFECVYCKTTDENLKYLKQHVFGRKRSSSDVFLKNPCGIRCVEEKLNHAQVPLTSVPNRFPWANVLCQDPAGYKRSNEGEISFEVSPKIRKQWFTYMVDIRGTDRTHKGLDRPASTPAPRK